MHKSSPANPERAQSGSALRASGLGTLAVLVLLGVGVTAGYMQWKAPEVRAIVDGRRSEVAAAPSAPEERLVHWLRYSNALIHNRLQEMRFSAEQPWLVTFASAAPSPSSKDLEIYGVDLHDMPRELGRIEGLTVVVRLPRARSLGLGALTGDHAPFVPIVPASQPLPDADRRAHELAAWALKGLAEALERDIPGTHLAIEIGPAASWAEIAAVRPSTDEEPGPKPSGPR